MKKKSLKEVYLGYCKRLGINPTEYGVYKAVVKQSIIAKRNNKKFYISDFMELMRDICNSDYKGLNAFERYKIVYSFKNCQRTELKYLAHWGEIEGAKRWDNYRNLQAASNTFDYKKEKHGWTKEQFDEYNANRAVTLDNLIRRHGEDAGKKMWEDYCKRQAVAGITLNYFIDKYGKEVGLEKYQTMLEKKLDAVINSSKRIFSHLELDVIMELRNLGFEFYNFNHTLTNKQGEVEIVPCYQFKLRDKDNLHKIYPYDGCILNKKILVEVHGDYWHKNMRSAAVVRGFRNSITPQKEVIIKRQANDEAKKMLAKECGFRLYVIWELDWRKRKEAVKAHFKRWVDFENGDYFTTERLDDDGEKS